MLQDSKGKRESVTVSGCAQSSLALLFSSLALSVHPSQLSRTGFEKPSQDRVSHAWTIPWSTRAHQQNCSTYELGLKAIMKKTLQRMRACHVSNDSYGTRQSYVEWTAIVLSWVCLLFQQTSLSSKQWQKHHLKVKRHFSLSPRGSVCFPGWS